MKYYTTWEMADLLDVSDQWLRRTTRGGWIPYYRFAGQYLYDDEHSVSVVKQLRGKSIERIARDISPSHTEPIETLR